MLASAKELVDVQLLPVAESNDLMLALAVVQLDSLAVVLSLLVVLVLVLLDSVVEALHFVPMAADVVSELVSMVASALVPLAQVPSEQVLEASLELELALLPLEADQFPETVLALASVELVSEVATLVFQAPSHTEELLSLTRFKHPSHPSAFWALKEPSSSARVL